MKYSPSVDSVMRSSALALACLLAVWCCTSSAKRGVEPARVQPEESERAESTPTPSVVKLGILRVDTDSALLEIENAGSKPIFVPYEPLDESNRETFVLYTFQKKARGQGFVPSGPKWHFVPALNPIPPHISVRFRVSLDGMKKGEYRVQVAYWDDPNCSDILNEKGPGMDNTEAELVHRSTRIALSESFIYPNNALSR